MATPKVSVQLACDHGFRSLQTAMVLLTVTAAAFAGLHSQRASSQRHHPYRPDLLCRRWAVDARAAHGPAASVLQHPAENPYSAGSRRR